MNLKIDFCNHKFRIIIIIIIISISISSVGRVVYSV